PLKVPRARGTPGVRSAHKFTQCAQTGCSDPRASTPRDVEASSTSVALSALRRIFSASPPVPRRPARGVCEVCSAKVPGGRAITRCRAYHRGGQALGPGSSDKTRPCRPSGPSTQRRSVGSFAAWTAGPWQAHLRRHVIPRPPLPIPYLKMLYRHPRCGMGCDQDKAALEGGDKFFLALKLRENFKKAASRSPSARARDAVLDAACLGQFLGRLARELDAHLRVAALPRFLGQLLVLGGAFPVFRRALHCRGAFVGVVAHGVAGGDTSNDHSAPQSTPGQEPSISSAAAWTRLSPATTMRPPPCGGPFSQVVTIP